MGYRNPVIPGFYPDPSICRVGQDYYLTTSSFIWFPGMPIFHSRDLVNWKQIGHILARREQLELREPLQEIWQGLWAPTLRYHDGRFYCTNINQGHKGSFLVWADDPAGPWSDPIWLEGGGWDNSMLIEDDGTCWYHRAGASIVQYKLDLASGKRLSPEREIFPGTGAGGLEAPHLYHIGDWYYLVVAEGGTHWGHQISIARGRAPWGPFEPSPHGPLLTHRHTEMSQVIKALGHGDLIQAHDGSWWLVCLGMRNYGWICFGSSHLGRETFLAPVTWRDDGWPIVNGGRDLELEMDVETLGLEPVSPPATRDDFDSDALGLEWNFLRNPLEGAIRPDREPGRLTLEARGKSLSSPEATMAARRQQHPYCKAACLITDVEGAGEAGLTAFMDQEHHCEIFVRTSGEGREVVVRGRSGTLEAELARRALPASGAVELWIRADPRWYRFGYARGEESESEIAATETRHLSVELTWSFTGAYFGLYCVSPGEARAAFEWFDYVPDPGREWLPSMDRG